MNAIDKHISKDIAAAKLVLTVEIHCASGSCAIEKAWQMIEEVRRSVLHPTTLDAGYVEAVLKKETARTFRQQIDEFIKRMNVNLKGNNP